MKIVYMSDDGKVCGPVEEPGSYAKVQDYEEKQRDPLAKMHFPWRVEGSWLKNSDNAIIGSVQGRAAEGFVAVAFANLAPLHRPVFEAAQACIGQVPIPLLDQIEKLHSAYKEALELAKKL